MNHFGDAQRTEVVMGKAEGSWSGMRKYLEQVMPAEVMRGRLRFSCMDHSIELWIDGRRFKQFSWETVNSYFIRMGYKNEAEDYWKGFIGLLAQYPIDSRTEYTDDEFCEALKTYRGNSIQESISSGNPIVKMFAILDRRTGKRTLDRIKNEIDTQPEWLRHLYAIRINTTTNRSENDVTRETIT